MDLFSDISAFDTGGTLGTDWRGSELPLDFMILKKVSVLPRPLDNLGARQETKTMVWLVKTLQGGDYYY